MSDRATFSPFWHRVRALKPRLRPHVQITRQHYRGGRWHVLHDPASNAFYRLSPVSYEFVALLDGTRSVEDVWEGCLAAHADDAPTQNEVIQLLSQLYTANLLAADVPPETEQLLKRGRERLKKRLVQQAMGLMYFRVRLFNPDRLLAWLEPIARPLLSRAGLVLWVLWVGFGISLAVGDWTRLRAAFDTATDPSNWMGNLPLLLVAFVAIKLIHESGHGLICKRFGGQVPEFGAMILVLVPAPYVDASAAWALPSKWKRTLVGAGGMLFELAVAAGAALVFTSTHDGEISNKLAFNIMLTSGVSTVLFNANPLMKFDGYYMLSDLLEIPNLMQRATQMLQYHALKHLYRAQGVRPPTGDPGESAILHVYGVLALAYRVFLFFSITLAVMGKLFAVGLILAVWTAAMWFILPLGKFVHWLATGSGIAQRRGRAVVVSLLLASLIAGLVGLVPMPDRRSAGGVVTSDARAGVFFGASGFVVRAHRRPGERVRAGEPIVTLESHVLEEQLRTAVAQLDEARAFQLRAIARNQAAAQVATEKLESCEQQLVYVRDKIDKLVVRAPHDGVVVGEDPARVVGAFVKEGQQVCDVVDDRPEHLRVTAGLAQTEVLWLNELPASSFQVELRRYADPWRVVPARASKVPQAGIYELEHPALGLLGGGSVESDPRDRSGRLAKRPTFQVECAVRPEDWPSAPRPGERVKVRFTLPNRPLAVQWVDRLHKLILGRARV